MAVKKSSLKDKSFPPRVLSRDATFRWRIPPSEESDPSKVEWALRERIKELNCLYGVAQLAENASDSIDEFLRRVVNILPPSWQYPEITCARLVLRGKAYKTKGFRATKWRQSARIVVFNEPAGEVEVFYLKECPPFYEGPFLREERALLDAVAEHVGAVAMRLSAENDLHETNRQLMVERQALREANAALKAVLARIEEEKRKIHKDIQANVEKVMMPIIYALMTEVPASQRKYVELLRDNLMEISSPFANQLTQKYHSLTPTEIAICNMVRSGLQSKEIAQMRSVSAATISRHRERIRHKLGIANTDVNLTTYLQTTM
ncbi:MAG: helix-turn-helix transcriptional regulator [Planctomycetes bacterium B3_Pla]|nr:MAG: helix-turn-helix transcriptional regulator [Planctomycetes bacterium B3_Pla]